MSIQSVAWVLEHCEATLGARCLMFAVANHTDENGENCWASVRTLAHEARISRTSAQKALKRLIESGELVETGMHPSGTRVLGIGGLTKLAGPTYSQGGANLVDGGGQPTTPDPVNEVGPNRPKPSKATVHEPLPREDAERLCKWLTAQAEEKEPRSYTGAQLEGAAWLLDNVDHAELRDAVAWAHTRAYWASRVRTAGRLRQVWGDLRADWRGATHKNRNGKRSVGPTSNDLRDMADQLEAET